MRKKIYDLFYEKLPDTASQVMPEYQGCRLVTFLNPYYMIKLQNSSYDLYKEFDYVCSDGIGPIILNKFWHKPKSERISFDMSGGNNNDGLAGRVFSKCSEDGVGVYILGSTGDSVEKFVEVVSAAFPMLKICGYHDGYIKDSWDESIDAVITSGAKVAIVGMGAPLQEKAAVDLKTRGFVGTVYTCGGFIHQTTAKMRYYPDWVDRYNLRALYRIFHEEGMFMRFVESYPLFIISYSRYLLGRKN